MDRGVEFIKIIQNTPFYCIFKIKLVCNVFQGFLILHLRWTDEFRSDYETATTITQKC